MKRDFYFNLANCGLRMPIGTDLALHEEQDPESARRSGSVLGRVVERAAKRWNTPLAFPLMDLLLEKKDLLAKAGIVEHEAESFQFSGPISHNLMQRLLEQGPGRECAGSLARDEAIEYIAKQADLIPLGMAIGPFSLASRLIKDPITPAALSGKGVKAEQSDEVLLLEQCLAVSEVAVSQSLRSQISRGAKVVVICEPAASTAFISPRQMSSGSDVFERLVMQPNLRLKAMLDEHGTDLIFHNCGELTARMVDEFGRRLHPAILSLGSSRRLWEDTSLLPKDVVLFGNLPSRLFYSDQAMPDAEVERLTAELVKKMKATGHPHIVGTECDVLFVAEAASAISRKVQIVMSSLNGLS